MGSLAHLFAHLFLIPAPFRQMVRMFKLWLGGKLGYPTGKLPYSYYSLSFLPYMIALVGLGFYLHKYKQKRLLNSLRIWFVTISFGLLALTKYGGTDIRPVLIALPLYAIGYMISMRFLAMPWLMYPAIASFSLWIHELGSYFGSPELGPWIFLVMSIVWLPIAWISKNKGKEKLFGVFVDSFILLLLLASLKFLHLSYHWPVDLHIIFGLICASLCWIFAVFILHFPGANLLFYLHLVYAVSAWTWRIESTIQALSNAGIFLSYGLTFVVAILRRWNAVDQWIKDWIRPGFQVKQDKQKLFIKPLYFLISLTLVISCLYLFPNTLESATPTSLLTWISLAIFALLTPKIFGINVPDWISTLPFAFALFFLLQNPGLKFVIPVLCGAAVYSLISGYARKKISLAAGLGGICYSLYFYLDHYCLSGFQILCIYAGISLVWQIFQWIVQRYAEKTLANVFKIYSLVMAAAIFFFQCLYFLQRFEGMPFEYGYSIAIFAILAITFISEAFNSKAAGYFDIAFGFLSLCLALSIDWHFPSSTFFPNKTYIAYSTSFCIWGAIWYLALQLKRIEFLQRFSIPKLKDHANFYPACSFGLAYILATACFWIANINPLIPAIIISLCSVYIFFHAIELQLRWPIYISSFFLKPGCIYRLLLSKLSLV